MAELKICPVILAGGSGTRFWPLSRENWPKQFLKLTGNKSLIRLTVERAEAVSSGGKTFVVAGQDLSEKMRLELMSDEIRIVVEPAAKNTAPAIALAAKTIVDEMGDGVMVIMPSDHVIKDEHLFLEEMKKAVEAAGEGFLVTLGIIPSRPETGYGYIKQGEPVSKGVFLVERFTEKPDREKAEGFLAGGDYYWNSGMFVWKASVFLEEVGNFLPEIHETLEFFGDDEGRFDSAFKGLKAVSVDYGVMERSKKVVVVPCSFTWSDVGSWPALDEVLDRDEEGNIMKGNAIAIDSRDSIIYAGKDLVAAVGIKNMIVVDTEDATLVIPKERSQDVRKIVELLKHTGARERVEHKTVQRPWGSYTVLLEGDGFKIKEIEVLPGKRLSLQMHHQRSEHWVVISGNARVTRDEEEYTVKTGESTFIPKLSRHRLENSGLVPLRIIEVQNGEYVGEDDIVRFEDDFGRPAGGGD